MTIGNGRTFTIGFGGFYSYASQTQHSSCEYTAHTDCAFVNIVDFDPSNENNTGPFGKLQTTTERELHHWGVAPFVQLGHVYGGGLKDDPVTYSSPFILGLEVRGLNERTKLHSVDISVPDPVDYRETLDTTYYGGFVGYRQTHQFGNGWSLSLDGRAGLYSAHSDMTGTYVSYIPIGGTNYIVEKGHIDRALSDVAFIGSLDIKASYNMGWGRLGINGNFDYYGYVPQVLYNNNDQAGGSPFGIIGTQIGTSLRSSDAWAASLGASVSVPLN